jgi:hypothetical protein
MSKQTNPVHPMNLTKKPKMVAAAAYFCQWQTNKRIEGDDKSYCTMDSFCDTRWLLEHSANCVESSQVVMELQTSGNLIANQRHPKTLTVTWCQFLHCQTCNALWGACISCPPGCLSADMFHITISPSKAPRWVKTQHSQWYDWRRWIYR